MPLTVALLGLLLFAALAWGVATAGPLVALDAALHARWVAGLGAGAIAAWSAFTHLGDTAVQWAAAAALTLALGRWAGRRTALAYALTCAGGGLWVRGLKLLFDRERPLPVHSDVLHPVSASFPSGHAMGAMVVYGALLVWVWPRLAPGWPRALALALAVGLIGGLGVSRVLLGVHWPSDVLAGWALGAAWVALALMAGRRWLRHHPG